MRVGRLKKRNHEKIVTAKNCDIYNNILMKKNIFWSEVGRVNVIDSQSKTLASAELHFTSLQRTNESHGKKAKAPT